MLQTSIGQGSEDRQYQEVGKKPIGIVTVEVYPYPYPYPFTSMS